jgi:general transcription factor IIIA
MADKTMEDSDDDFERLSDISLADAASLVDSLYSQDELDSLDLPDDSPVTTPASDSYHDQSTSDKGKKFKCTYEGCSKAFNRPIRLEDHLRSHINDRAYRCPHEGCSNTYLRLTHLNQHIKSAHTQIRDYKCTWKGCDKAFTTGTKLRKHLAVHEGHEKYRCRGFEGCDQTFRKKETLQRHIVAVHLGAKPFPCPAESCNKAFDTGEHLRQHQRVNHNPFRYSCNLCLETINADDKLSDVGKQELRKLAYFSNWSDFQVHNRDVHPPTCSTCNKQFPTNRALTAHHASRHEGMPAGETREKRRPGPAKLSKTNAAGTAPPVKKRKTKHTSVADTVMGWDSTNGLVNHFTDGPDLTGDDTMFDGRLVGDYGPSLYPDPTEFEFRF